MQVKIVSNAEGISTAIFINLEDWKTLKKNYHIEAEEGELSDAHLKEFGLRIKDYIQNPDARKDLDEVRKKYTS